MPEFTGDGEVRFRPVLGVVPAERAEGSEGELYRGSSGLLYELGAPLPADLVESASAERGPVGNWIVALRMREGRPGIEDFNDLAMLCFERAAECPTGYIAAVVEDFVISAPAIQTPTPFERDGLQISGDFTEQQARAITASDRLTATAVVGAAHFALAPVAGPERLHCGRRHPARHLDRMKLSATRGRQRALRRAVRRVPRR
ncbi:MAG: hypothetical protein U5R31_14865 [Acidimicrobiia bacterium]|nr:hypothetical protein [Acidimicrobiia bacterium]